MYLLLFKCTEILLQLKRYKKYYWISSNWGHTLSHNLLSLKGFVLFVKKYSSVKKGRNTSLKYYSQVSTWGPHTGQISLPQIKSP